MPDASFGVARLSWRGGAFEAGQRIIPTEVPVAITYGGSTQAVMMATPSDLEDFAVGFSVTEGLIHSTSDIRSLEVIEEEEGVELRMWLAPELADAYSRRRRLLAGPTGCGLCGIESLTEAIRTPPSLSVQVQYTPAEIIAAMASLGPAQVLNQQTRATHAAGFWSRSSGILAVREDVGRHNALDKLAGHVLRTGTNAADGIIVLTSRVSVEMVQKAAMMGTPVIAAVSAPTALAVRTAEAAGITLIAVARGDEFELFTHIDRVQRNAD